MSYSHFFTCPKCGGHHFGTVVDYSGESIGYCHGNDEMLGNCFFSWNRRDDHMYTDKELSVAVSQKLAVVFKPPHSFMKRPRIFLAGSIEMGSAEDWQATVQRKLDSFNVDVYNPRRDDWDSTWTQSIDNPNFRTQVEWELDALESADVILMYFDPNTKSPISLLELGLYAASGKLIVVCPSGFWRKGNVDVVCNRYNIHQYDTLDTALTFLTSAIIDKCGHHE